MDLHEAAQELYAVLPRDFTSERTTLVRTAKEAGYKELAQEIGRLPKPAAGAWAINMLAVHKPEVIDGVVRFGASLRAAQEESDAAAFRELSQQRQGQLTTAVHAAKDLAGEFGAPLSAAAASPQLKTSPAPTAPPGRLRNRPGKKQLIRRKRPGPRTRRKTARQKTARQRRTRHPGNRKRRNKQPPWPIAARQNAGLP